MAKPSKYFHCFPVRLGLFHLSPNSLDRDTYSRYIKVVLRNPQSSEQRGSNFGLIFFHKGHKYCAAVSQVLIRHILVAQHQLKPVPSAINTIKPIPGFSSFPLPTHIVTPFLYPRVHSCLQLETFLLTIHSL